MSDRECLELLRLLHKYVTAYPESADSALTVEAVADDCLHSMEYDPEAEQLRDEIGAALAPAALTVEENEAVEALETGDLDADIT